MKIPASIRALYADQKEDNERLKAHVDGALEGVARERRWYYESRVKQEDSVALKIESGRIGNLQQIEDFFACTLVVRNLTEVAAAEELVTKMFTLSERRPKDAGHTHKNADAFPFDDVRLYVHWKDDPRQRPTGLEGNLFEIQIKTFLQHAWGIATHDLVYKTDDVNWSKERIAYQIKAMLEHAEVSIQEAQRLAETSTLAKTHRATQELKDIIALLREVWDATSLPRDLRRLAENTRTLMRLADVELARLKDLIAQERVRNSGNLPINISPYAIIVQALAWGEPAKLKKSLADKRKREKMVVTSEMVLPDWMTEKGLVNIVNVQGKEPPAETGAAEGAPA